MRLLHRSPHAISAWNFERTAPRLWVGKGHEWRAQFGPISGNSIIARSAHNAPHSAELGLLRARTFFGQSIAKKKRTAIFSQQAATCIVATLQRLRILIFVYIGSAKSVFSSQKKHRVVLLKVSNMLNDRYVVFYVCDGTSILWIATFYVVFSNDKGKWFLSLCNTNCLIQINSICTKDALSSQVGNDITNDQVRIVGNECFFFSRKNLTIPDFVHLGSYPSSLEIRHIHICLYCNCQQLIVCCL